MHSSRDDSPEEELRATIEQAVHGKSAAGQPTSPVPPVGEQPTVSLRDAGATPPGDLSDTVAETIPSLSTLGGGADATHFGDYEILGEIARGGMGVVFKARQKRLNRTVALKMILAGQLASTADIKRFYTEAEASAQLDHSGIVPIYQVGQHGSQHFFSMAFIDGQSLQDRLMEGPLPPREAAEMLAQVADAVRFAHSKGIVHRDLKPHNILLDADGKSKVTDFGLARRMDGGEGLTNTGDVMGTPSYMAPEQAAGQTHEQGPLVDVYALGAVLYATLTGRPPFQAASLAELLRQVIHQEPAAPTLVNAAIPPDLDTICLKCLHKDPQRRYVSAKELQGDLLRFLRGEPIAARPIGKVERASRWCRRNPLVAGLAATTASLLVVGVLASSYFAVRERQRANEAQTNFNNAEKERRRADAKSAESARNLATAERLRGRAEQLAYSSQLALSYREWELGDVEHSPPGCDTLATMKSWKKSPTAAWGSFSKLGRLPSTGSSP